MTFLLCFLATGFGFMGCVLAAAGIASLLRRNWTGAIGFLGMSAIQLGLYAVAWKFLPMENWLICPAIPTVIVSIGFFALVLRTKPEDL